MDFHSLRIKEIINETADTLVVKFEIPSELKSIFSFIPGQYVTISDSLNGEELRRSYSICSAPWEEDLAIGVKLVRGGKMSTHIHKTYTVGKEVNVSSPEGKFILEADEDNNNDYYFIAAGSGITPIKSMIENVLENEPLSRCYVLYGSRNENSIIFNKRFDEIQKKYQGQIEIVHSLSKPLKEKKKGLAGVFSSKKTTWDGEMGRIDKNKIETFLENHPSIGNDKQYFLCGPGTLIEIAEALLLEKGIDKKSIHREYFVSGDAPAPLSSEDAKAATIVVTLNGETFEYNSDGKLPILEELINQKKNPPYSCTSGACSSCVAKIKEGEASMEVCYALDDDEVENGYILTCQARAKTQKLSIEFE